MTKMRSAWAATRGFPLFWVIGGIGFVAVWTFHAFAQTAAGDFRPQQVVPPFPPITNFPTKSVREARDVLNPSEVLLGVTVGNESRAYPINMLTGPQREILNDRLGGKAIAATW